MKSRRLIAVDSDGQTVATRTTHRPYACAVVYDDPDRRPTWHGSLELAERAARRHPGTIYPVQPAQEA